MDEPVSLERGGVGERHLAQVALVPAHVAVHSYELAKKSLCYLCEFNFSTVVIIKNGQLCAPLWEVDPVHVISPVAWLGKFL